MSDAGTVIHSRLAFVGQYEAPMSRNIRNKPDQHASHFFHCIISDEGFLWNGHPCILRLKYLQKISSNHAQSIPFIYFIRNYNPKSIISYCDYSKFSGDVYNRLGFKKMKNSTPSKHWYNGKQHITDNLLRQRGYDQLFNTHYGKGTSNEQLMLENGFVEIYDCGQMTFIWSSD